MASQVKNHHHHLLFNVLSLYRFSNLYVCVSLCSFELRLRVSLAIDGDLTLTSRVRNINSKPFSFLFAFHTYLSVSDIRYFFPLISKTFCVFGEIQKCSLVFWFNSEVRVEGLETLDYLDNLRKRELLTEQGDSITFESEVKIMQNMYSEEQSCLLV